jgi:hypothetical protein
MTEELKKKRENYSKDAIAWEKEVTILWMRVVLIYLFINHEADARKVVQHFTLKGQKLARSSTSV